MGGVANVELKIAVEDGRTVSALLMRPAEPRVCLTLAHGAGAGMRHSFLEAIAAGFAKRHVATFRFQFPYMEQGSRRPDSGRIAQATVRAALAVAAKECPALPLFAGGKSFGGRMTSQAQADAPLAGVMGLVFFGFPLHPAGKPSIDRAQHLALVRLPMLFLQGTRDALAEATLLQKVTQGLGTRATVRLVQNADHSFHVPARTGMTDSQVMDDLIEVASGWMFEHARSSDAVA